MSNKVKVSVSIDGDAYARCAKKALDNGTTISAELSKAISEGYMSTGHNKVTHAWLDGVIFDSVERAIDFIKLVCGYDNVITTVLRNGVNRNCDVGISIEGIRNGIAETVCVIIER